jgi:ferric-dicitrate binding protein FerR (iron transport regulator)
VFKRTPLREVVPQLSRWYDTDIQLADSALNDLRVSGSYSDEPVDQVLQSIAMTLGLAVRRTDASTVVLAPAAHTRQ